MLTTLGYDQVGTGFGVSVSPREIRDTDGGFARGIIIDVKESEYRSSRAFIDTEEVLYLLKGIDEILSIDSNPTPFKMFEVRYATKDDFSVTVFNSFRGRILYSVGVGNPQTASRTGLSADEIRKLRVMLEDAYKKIISLALGDTISVN